MVVSSFIGQRPSFLPTWARQGETSSQNMVQFLPNWLHLKPRNIMEPQNQEVKPEAAEMAQIEPQEAPKVEGEGSPLSDGGAHIKFLALGVYPTDLLSWQVRDTGVLSLEEAHFRLSALPAWAARLDWVARLHHAGNGVPYGVALAAAGLALYPSSPIWRAATGL